jgi:hypothetical protein
MGSVLKPLLLPALVGLGLSMDDCESSPDYSALVSVTEDLVVHQDASVDVALEFEADSIKDLLDQDPPPSLEAGWDSVHLGHSGRRDYALQGWNRFPPGAELPGSFASPGDPLLPWYIRFPTTVRRDVAGDTVIFRFERTYPQLGWIPLEVFQGLPEKIERLEERIWESDDDLDEKGEAFDDRWEDSAVLEDPEEVSDTALFSLLRQDLREVLLSVGDPPWLEDYRQLVEAQLRLGLLSELALAIPAADSLPGDDHADCSEIVMPMILAAPEAIEVSEDEALTDFAREFDIEGAAWGRADTLNSDAIVEELGARTLEDVRDALVSECRFSSRAVMEFDRRFRWLNGRYHIDLGDLDNWGATVYLTMPGELLTTNADTAAGGRLRWRLRMHRLLEGEVRLFAESRVVGG